MPKKLSLLLALAVSMGACGEYTDPPAATVAEREIRPEEVSRPLDRFRDTQAFQQRSQQEGEAAVARQFQQGYLAQLIRGAVFEKEAREMGITITDADIDDRIESIKEGFPSEEAFDQAMAGQGLTLEQLRGLIRGQVAEEEVRAEVVAPLRPTEEELRSYYASHRDDYRSTKAGHILVKKRSLADKLYKELANTKRKDLPGRFARLARKFSEDPQSAKQGGDLGFFSPGQFVPPFERAAGKLAVGAVSRPVRSEVGFHLIRVTDRRVTPFQEVRGEIEQQLSSGEEESAFQEFVIEAYRDADIELDPRYGKLDVETQQVVNLTAEDVPGAEAPETPAGPTPAATPAPTPTS
jgi:foldase protein PrsA